jgi:hypothetical protein
MNRFKSFFLLFIFCLTGQSCVSQETSIPPSPTMTESIPTAPVPSMILNPSQLTGQTVTLAVGDVFAVSLPDESFTWQVNFADTVIQSLTPLEKMTEPDSPGWIFRALAPGQTDIRVTASAAVCDAGTPCPPPAPITFVFTIEVK